MQTLKKHQSIIEFAVVIILPAISLFAVLVYCAVTYGTYPVGV